MEAVSLTMGDEKLINGPAVILAELAWDCHIPGFETVQKFK